MSRNSRIKIALGVLLLVCICAALPIGFIMPYRVTSTYERTALRLQGSVRRLADKLEFDTIMWSSAELVDVMRVPQIKIDDNCWNINQVTPTVVKSWGGKCIDETSNSGSFYFCGNPVESGAGYVLRFDFDRTDRCIAMYLRVDAMDRGRHIPVVIAEDGVELVLPVAGRDADKRFGRCLTTDREMLY